MDKIKDIKLEEGELPVSFVVTSLFPSIPIDVRLKYLDGLQYFPRVWLRYADDVFSILTPRH